MTVGILASQWLGRPPLTVQFTGNVAGNMSGITNWRWEFGDGDIVEDRDVPRPIHTYEEEGTYTVTLTVSTDLSTSSVTRRNLIVVTQTVPLASPGVLGMLALALFLSGVYAARVRACTGRKVPADDGGRDGRCRRP